MWFCYTKPDKSWGTLDLYIDAPNLLEPYNLHVSAQLGEWPVNKPDLEPKVSNSDLWWEIDGWWANVVAFNGMKEKSDGTQRINFKLAPARELVLSKTRFGQGEWKLQFNINSVMIDGELQTILHPNNVDDERVTYSLHAQ